MWLTEFNEEEFKEAMREEGRLDACLICVGNLMKNTDMTLENACKALDISIEDYNHAKELLDANII